MTEGELGDIYTAETIILRTVAQAKWLGIPGEIDFPGAGISACATCDGPSFMGNHVAIIRGGDTAVEEALFLSNVAGHVALIHRSDEMRAEKVLQDNLLGTENIEVMRSQRRESFFRLNGKLAGVNLVSGFLRPSDIRRTQVWSPKFCTLIRKATF